MPRYGFVGDMPDTKNLILFVMRHVQASVTIGELGEMVMLDDNFNYFIFADAVSEMVESGHLEKDAEGRVSITPKGAEAGRVVESSLAVALRRVAAEAAAQVAERIKRDSAVLAEAFCRDGEHYLRCVLTDGVSPLIEMTLYAGSERQAVLLAKRWRQKAEGIYGGILESFVN